MTVASDRYPDDAQTGEPLQHWTLLTAHIFICLTLTAEGVSAGKMPSPGATHWAPIKVERSYLDSARPELGSRTTYRGEHPSRATKGVKERAVRGRREASPAGSASDRTGTVIPQGAQPSIVTSAPPTTASAAAEKDNSPDLVAPVTTASTSKAESAEYKGAVQKFCAGIGQVATEARVAWQLHLLAGVEKDIEDRIKRLEAKIDEHREWLRKREVFGAMAGGALVQVVKRMKPEAAAQQLMQMDEQTAASLILTLDPKVAALLLDEMPADKAAHISTILAGAAGTPRPKRAADRGAASSSNRAVGHGDGSISGNVKPTQNAPKVHSE